MLFYDFLLMTLVLRNSIPEEIGVYMITSNFKKYRVLYEVSDCECLKKLAGVRANVVYIYFI